MLPTNKVISISAARQGCCALCPKMYWEEIWDKWTSLLDLAAQNKRPYTRTDILYGDAISAARGTLAGGFGGFVTCRAPAGAVAGRTIGAGYGAITGSIGALAGAYIKNCLGGLIIGLNRIYGIVGNKIR